MKKFILISLAALALMACSRIDSPDESNSVAEGSRVSLSVSVAGDLVSKATTPDTDNEARVANLQVFVFREGKIDAFDNVRSSSAVLSVTAGESVVYALVNAPDLSSVKTLEELKASVSKLTDNDLDSFVMAGSVTRTFVTNTSVTIAVDRLAARVRIAKITRDFASRGLADLDASSFRIVRFFLTQVVGNLRYDFAAPDSYLWYNVSSVDVSSRLFYNKLSVAAELAQNASYTTPQSLYCYPNPLVADSETGKVTRLVVECLIDGKYYTYPILLKGGVESNKSYEVTELVITRLGNPSNGDDVLDPGEDDPIATVNATFELTVNDWGLVLVGDESGVVTI